jgi:ubiquinone/menaquinone biosynthesis C-methylase UbiE
LDYISANKKYYEDNAEEYTRHVRDSGESVYHYYYEKPAMYGLLPDSLVGQNALSLGCGSGEDCEELRKRGAKVSGIDLSSGLIDQAKLAYPGCDYYVGSMDNLGMFPDKSFDLVYSSLALHYLDDWRTLFSEVDRVLKKGGRFLFSMQHPLIGGKEKVELSSGEVVSGLASIKYINKPMDFVGDYFTANPRKGAFKMDTVVVFQKTIEQVFDYANSTSLSIVNIREPKPLPEMEQISNLDWRKLSSQPYFIIYDLKKVNL